MTHLNLENLHKVAADHGLSEAELNAAADRIAGYLEKIDTLDQGFYSVIDDNSVLERIESFADSVKGDYDSIVVLGIGGSALGTICLEQSLTHLHSNMIELDRPDLFVLDNIDPALIRETEDVLDLERTLFIVVTKSGGTPETLSQYYYFRNRIEEHALPVEKHFVFITDPKKGLLREVGEEEDIPMFDVPPNVGGRFSVLTSVGLLPAALIGLPIRELIDGARHMRDLFREEDADKNLPYQLAAIQYLLSQKGKSITVLMPYAQKLIKLADWYRQLLAESIGKQKNRAGETVNVGLTPVNALGATDQHSQSQLYNEGPNDKLIVLIKLGAFPDDLAIPLPEGEDLPTAYLKGVSFGQLLNTELAGTAQALTEYDRPNLTIELAQLNAETLGELFMLFEGATAFLGEFFEIDAFDQPGVELSKTLTKQLLQDKR